MNLPELAQFHFIRPYCLLIIVPALLMAASLFKREKNSSAWQQHFDAVLLEPLLHGKINRPSGNRFIIIMLFWIICALALAGPTWEKLPTPVEKRDTALVILLDLSPSMLANDVKPSRLIAARHKIMDLLRLRKEGYSALIAYSGDAHVVSPLTDDTKTIANLLNALEPGMMPVYGSNLEDGLTKALILFKNAGYTHGDILLLTDGITEQTLKQAAPILSGSLFTLSIIGVGTEAGAPIPDNSGGFLKDRKGTIILPQLQESGLRALAQQLDGYYSPLQLDDRDIQPLIEGRTTFNSERHADDKNGGNERKFDLWRDAGGILSLLLIPFLLMAFRRGVLISLIITLPLIQPEKVQADTGQAGWHLPSWESLWLNDNQRGMKAMRAKDYKNAATYFTDAKWKATAQYESGDYAAALTQFRADSSADGFYNQANALAKSGQLHEAVTAYKEALKKNPQHDDAAFNKKIVEDLLKEQEKQNQPGDTSPSQDENNNQDKDKNGNRQENRNSGQQNDPDKSAVDPENQNDASKAEKQKARKENEQSKSDAEAQMEKSDSGKDQPTENRLTPEQKQTLEQWLRQVPDDPSGLLRNKFEYYYQQRLQGQQTGEADKHLNDEERW